MSSRIIRNTLAVVSAVICGGAWAATWTGAKDGNWADPANWEGGAVCPEAEDAVFGETAGVKAVLVTGSNTAKRVVFRADGYSLAGGGTLSAEKVFVNTNCTLDVGEVTVRTARFMPGAEDEKGYVTAYLRLDGTTLEDISNADDSILCYGRSEFARATIGAKGLTVRANGMTRISQPLSTADGVEADGGIRCVQCGSTDSDKVVFDGDRVSTFKGGVSLDSCEVRVKNVALLGSGPIRHNNAIYKMYVTSDTESVISIVNRVIVGHDSSICVSYDGAHTLVFHSVGADGGTNPSRRFCLGRNDMASSAVLKLDDPGSEAMGGFSLRGMPALAIDGGVIKAAPTACSPFFNAIGLADEYARAKVLPGGFVFDSNGADVDLGIALDLSANVQTNVIVHASAFANPSFESNTNGWTFGTTSSGRQANTSAFTKPDATYYTTNGSYYVALRQNDSMTSTFTVPEEGDWRVSYECACRPESNYKTHLIPMTNTIDGEIVLPIGPRAAKHRFIRLQTETVHLAAGEHTLRVKAGANGVSYDTLLVDAFRMERVEAVAPVPPVVKRGEGTLRVPGLATAGSVAVEGGTLDLAGGYALDGADVTVAEGATLAVAGGRMGKAAVRVAAGGALAFADAHGANVVKNGSFEIEYTADYLATSAVTKNAPGWTFSSTHTDHYSGVQRNGGTMSKDGYSTPCGGQSAFVRFGSAVEQTVPVAAAGAYDLSFLHATRRLGYSFNLPLVVTVDGEPVIDLAPRTTHYDYTNVHARLELAAGEHVLKFSVGDADQTVGAMLFIDDVRLEPVAARDLAGTAFALARGAKVVLNNADKLVLEEGQVTVDGQPFVGSRSALERAGVVVSGTGRIQVGPPGGMTILFR